MNLKTFLGCLSLVAFLTGHWIIGIILMLLAFSD